MKSEILREKERLYCVALKKVNCILWSHRMFVHVFVKGC